MANNNVAKHYGAEGYGMSGAKKGPNTKRKLGRASSTKAKLGKAPTKITASARAQSAAARRRKKAK